MLIDCTINILPSFIAYFGADLLNEFSETYLLVHVPIILPHDAIEFPICSKEPMVSQHASYVLAAQ